MNIDTLKKLIDIDRAQAFSFIGSDHTSDNVLFSKLREKDYKKAIYFTRHHKPSYKQTMNIPPEYTFGLEIEFSDADLDKVQEEMANAGIENWQVKLDDTVTERVTVSQYPDTQQKMMDELLDKYYQGEFEEHSDVYDTSMPNPYYDEEKAYGGEVTSPILVDKPESWAQLEKVCKIIENCGGKITDDCGGHIHVGMAVLDHSPKRWQRLFQIWQCFEDVVLRLSGGQDGSIRSGFSEYAKPISSMMSDFTNQEIIIDSPEDIKKLAIDFSKMGLEDKSVDMKDVSTSINITHLSFPFNEKNTVEFRSFNGTLDPVTWQSDVLVACGIVRAAADLSIENETTKHRIELLEKNLKRVQNNEYHFEPEGNTKKFLDFLDIVFTDHKDKIRVFSQWSNTKEVDLSNYYKSPQMHETSCGKER